MEAVKFRICRVYWQAGDGGDRMFQSESEGSTVDPERADFAYKVQRQSPGEFSLA